MASAPELSNTRPLGWGGLLSKTWRLYTGNPAFLITFAIGGAINLCCWLAYFMFFLSALVAQLRLAGAGFSDTGVVLAKSGIILKSFGLIAALVVAVAARGVFTVFHHAGWAGMAAATLENGRATVNDYFRGMFRWTPRFLSGSIIKLCLHGIPALALALAALGLKLAGVLSGSLMIAAAVLVPVLALIEGGVTLYLAVWRPACVIEDLPAGDAFACSGAFARRRFGDILNLYACRAFYNLLVCAVFGAAAFALIRVLPSGGMSGVALANTALIAWLFLMLGAIYFHLLNYVLYDDRYLHLDAKQAADGADDAEN